MPTNWERKVTHHSSDKGTIFKIYKALVELHKENKLGEEKNRNFHKEEIQVVKR